MTFFKLTVLAAVLMTSGYAFAEETAGTTSGESGSEFFYQTGAGKMDLTPRLEYTSMTTKGTTAAVVPIKTETNGSTLGLNYGYGINEMFAVDADLEYVTEKNKTTVGGVATSADRSGLADIGVNFRGTQGGMGAGTLRYGLESLFSLGDKETKANGDTTANSGGHTFAPYVGYEMGMGTGIFGGKLAYEVFKTEASDKDDAGVTTKTEGGNKMSLGAFYEMMMDMMRFGGALTYNSYAKTKTKVLGATTTTDGYNTLGLKLYAPYYLTPEMAILPSFDYVMLMGDKYPGLTSADLNGWTLAVGFRFML
jgi:hypothetical protein